MKCSAFTEEQIQARRYWKQASESLDCIVNGLVAPTINPTRENLHKKLDLRLDRIEKLENKARTLFPDVQKSFTIATYTLGKRKYDY